NTGATGNTSTPTPGSLPDREPGSPHTVHASPIKPPPPAVNPSAGCAEDNGPRFVNEPTVEGNPAVSSTGAAFARAAASTPCEQPDATGEAQLAAPMAGRDTPTPGLPLRSTHTACRGR